MDIQTLLRTKSGFDWFPTILVPIMIVSMAFLTRQMSRMTLMVDDRSKERRKALLDNIAEKLKDNIDLNVQDILNIGRGVGASHSDSIGVIFQLLAAAKDGQEVAAAKKLVAELNAKEPFEDLPEEVKPSLLRLSEMCKQATSDSDKSLLIPVHRALATYKTMLIDHATIKSQSRISYVVAIVSVCIGIVGLVLAFRTPSVKAIEQVVGKCFETRMQTLKPN